MKAYKVFTSELCSPVQGGDPVWDGSLPFRLSEVEVDESEKTCSAGWNACEKLSDALRFGGLWPNGWPSCAYVVEDPKKPLKRNEKTRASTWTLTRKCTESEVEVAVREMSLAFGEHAERMAKSQMLWREALGRPFHDVDKVKAGLHEALKIRGLAWKLKRFDAYMYTLYASAARYTWWDAWSAMSLRYARAAWDAKCTLYARAAWAARTARYTLDVMFDWAARAAMAALIVEYASLMGWIDYAPDFLTSGIQTAYKHGLDIAIPTGPNEIGWSMIKEAA